MKKIMPTLALIFCVVGLAGYGFKLMHWPGASIMLLVSTAGLLVLWFFWFISKKLNMFNLVFFLFGVSFLAGYALKMQHWPGASIVLGLMPVFAILLLTLEMMKKK